MEDTLQYEVGPHRVSGPSIFYRALAAALGGLGGSLLLFLFILLANQILATSGQDVTNLSPVLIFIGAVSLFLSSLISNALACFLISLTDQRKYLKVGKGILQILLINLIIFIFILPIFLIVKATMQEFIFYIAALQFLFSAMASGLVFNAVAVDTTQTLINIYSVVLGVFLGILLLSFIIVATKDQPVIAFFLLPTVIWFSLGFFSAMIEYYYYQLYKRSGIDFLQTQEGYVDKQEQTPEETDEEQV